MQQARTTYDRSTMVTSSASGLVFMKHRPATRTLKSPVGKARTLKPWGSYFSCSAANCLNVTKVLPHLHAVFTTSVT